MFKLRIADYINSNMLEHGLTYKDLARISGVSDSSIHTSATAKVNNPNEDNLIRIAAAFGDPPEIIQQMRREALESTAEENNIIARSNDKERMEEFASLVRSNVAQILEEFRTQSAAQQTEIIEHADKRVDQERERYKERLDIVSHQYAAEVETIREQASEKMEMLRERAKIIAEEKQKNCAECKDTHTRTIAYLKTTVRNLSIALIVLSISAVIGLSMLGGYAFYAYHTFDRNDPTQGLYRETPAPADGNRLSLEE